MKDFDIGFIYGTLIGAGITYVFLSEYYERNYVYIPCLYN